MSNSFKTIINPQFKHLAPQLKNIIRLFDEAETTLQDNRNVIKRTTIESHSVVIKSFKKTGLLKGFIYKYLRKSKACRSYEHAQKLTALGFSTPLPIAYIEEHTALGLRRSYFITLFQEHEYTIRDVLKKRVDKADEILEKFVHFTFDLHNASVLHLDHSPGNTLISHNNDGYTFSLIDINRMRFKPLSLAERLNNFVRLSSDKTTIRQIADAYAKLSGEPSEKCFGIIDRAAKRHFQNLAFRRRLKKQLTKWK